jgi:hypothetical protein
MARSAPVSIAHCHALDMAGLFGNPRRWRKSPPRPAPDRAQIVKIYQFITAI